MLNGSLLISWACDYPVPFTCNTYKAKEGSEPPPSSLEDWLQGPYQTNHGYMHVCVWKEIVVGEFACVSNFVSALVCVLVLTFPQQ